eukprot:3757443-Rhodomonas_salina.1
MLRVRPYHHATHSLSRCTQHAAPVPAMLHTASVPAVRLRYAQHQYQRRHHATRSICTSGAMRLRAARYLVAR